jgi:hypothetical protein
MNLKVDYRLVSKGAPTFFPNRVIHIAMLDPNWVYLFYIYPCTLVSCLLLPLILGVQLLSCSMLPVLGVPGCHCPLPSHCGLVHGVQGCHSCLVYVFPARHRCLLARCCPVLDIIGAFLLLLFASFILATADIKSSCLGLNDGELNTFLALLYLLLLCSMVPLGLVMLT